MITRRNATRIQTGSGGRRFGMLSGLITISISLIIVSLAGASDMA